MDEQQRLDLAEKLGASGCRLEPGPRTMTKGEREDLIRLVKQREKVAKTAAEQRSAAMLADFERQVTDLHPFDRDEVWKASVESVIEATRKANEEIAKQSDALGIPQEFQPRVDFHYSARGQATWDMRRIELRRLAKAEIDALEKVARVQIESASVQAQTEIIASGLSSQAALEFLNNLPAVESMMPALDVTAIQAKLADRARRTHGYSGPRLIE
jgi:hypothetical protein